jgi:copper homeostasis protein
MAAAQPSAAVGQSRSAVPNLEVPIFGAVSTAILREAKITRIELNAADSYAAGGLTPSLRELRSVIEVRDAARSKIIAEAGESAAAFAVRVMIRPRGPPTDPEVDGIRQQDFVYDGGEFEVMKKSLREIRDSSLLRAEMGDGFVFGLLKHMHRRDGRTRRTSLALDEERCRELVQLAAPFPCVFHRAFDDALGSLPSTNEARDALLHSVIACGFKGLLTSGGPGNAPDNKDVLAEIVSMANDKLEIIIGGGVRGRNVRELADAVSGTGSTRHSVWFHSSCLSSGRREGDEEMVDPTEVSAIISRLVDVQQRTS